jgi:PKD repeat protein
VRRATALGVAAAVTTTTLVAVPLVAAPSAQAAAGDAGTRGASLVGFASATPTAAKPESKLWFANGWWWASMASATGYTIHRLDRPTRAWVDTGVVLDARGATQSDTLWNGTHLFVASHAVASSSTATSTLEPARLLRYSWTGTTWTLDAGFPVTITDSSSESLTIAQTSAGRIWATWTKNRRLYVAQTTGSADAAAVTFGSAGIPTMSNLLAADSTAATTLDADDISTVVSADGVTTLVWSNQTAGQTWSARRTDTGSTWSAAPILSGPLMSDDHLNVRAIPGDPQRRVVAVLKTSLNDSALSLPTDPLLVAAVFTPSLGTWSTSTIATVAESATRPIAVVDPASDVLHVYYTGPSSSGGVAAEGTVYEKSAPLSTLLFPATGTPTLRDVTNATMNNATSTKQTVTAASGVVVLAATESAPRYWFATSGGAAGAPALAAFTTAAGADARSVRFTDTSAGRPTSWQWSFGDGTTSTSQSPSHTYASSGPVVVRLTVDNASGPPSTFSRSIVVGVPPAASYTVTQPSRQLLAVDVTDTSTGAPESVTWDFGDGSGAVAAAVGATVHHDYAVAGSYVVTLTATNGVGSTTVDHPTSSVDLGVVVHSTAAQIAKPTRTLPGPRAVTVRWRAPQANGEPITTYQVLCRTGTSFKAAYVKVADGSGTVGAARQGTVKGLTVGRRYACVVKAFGPLGWNVPSVATTAFTARA